MYHFLPDKIVATCPRVGSRSIREALQGHPEYGPGAANLTFDERPVIMWVRDPLERFESAFRMLYDTKEILVSYEGLVDGMIDRDYGDAHITSQTEHHRQAFESATDIRVYPFEQINELWDEVVGVGSLPHKGSGTGVKRSYEYRRADLLRWYADDMRLRYDN